MNLRFVILRVKNASLAEILYRIKVKILLLRLGMSMKYGDWPLQVPGVNRCCLDALRLPSFDAHASMEAIEGLLQCERWSLNTDFCSIARFEGRVQRDFFTRIERRREDPDIRAVWETARLQHVTALLQYAHRTPKSDKSDTCKEFARTFIFDWINKNPFLFGPHYSSVMECGLRIPVFFFVLACLDLDGAETDKVLTTLYHHAWWIEKRLSLYSSLGNHTVCECVGLVFAGAVFRESGEGKRWLDKGIQLLGQELVHQILSDGGPAEQSLNYHRFVLDLYWLAIDFLESNGLSDCKAWKSRLLTGEEFLAAFQDGTGNQPAIGDSDDGHAVAPGFAPKRGVPIGGSEGSITFADAGYTVIHTKSGVLFTFDHGPLGMAPLYNHGHADALSVTLSLSGVQMLVDSGTYRYNGVPEWRKYFKGTRSHNTVTIDGKDQAVQETGFIWSGPYAAELLRKVDMDHGILLEARHDGYTHLKRPVIHTRTILCSCEGVFIIRDSFSGRGMHEFELYFHLNPDCKADEHDGTWIVSIGFRTLFMTLLSPGDFSYVSGQEEKILGWYSPAYGIKQRCGVLQTLRKGMPDEVTFVSALCVHKRMDMEKLKEMAASL
jgi:hypothetical protein